MSRGSNLDKLFHDDKRKLRVLILQQNRGDSNLGSRQGSHVSAYSLLQQLTDSLSHIDNIITIEDKLTSLLDIFSLYLTNEETQNLFDTYQGLRPEIEVEILNSIKNTIISPLFLKIIKILLNKEMVPHNNLKVSGKINVGEYENVF